MPTVPVAPFGSTGHRSSRILFGAAALYAIKPERAAGILETLLEYGVNHIDTAADYGRSEQCLAPWLREHRSRFFLATKTGSRTRDGARESLHRSLERMQVDSVDMLQLHNLVAPGDWETAMGPGGALEAALEARREGLVRFIGVTGHGHSVAARHLASLERFPFDSVLLPYNPTMMRQAGYAADFEKLVARSEERGVAVQTIKAVARRRWADPGAPHFSWYEPLTDEDAIRRGVHYVLSRPGLFLNSSSDARLLPAILRAACEDPVPPPAADIDADIARYGIEPLFQPGVDEI